MDGKTDQLLEDVMIAATALVHLVTTRHERVLVPLQEEIVNPF